MPVATASFNPWDTDVAIDGTDGFQFAPDSDETDIYPVFRMDLARNMNYTWTMDMEEFGVETYMLMPSAD